jgi:hypothetical protein
MYILRSRTLPTVYLKLAQSVVRLSGRYDEFLPWQFAANDTETNNRLLIIEEEKKRLPKEIAS